MNSGSKLGRILKFLKNIAFWGCIVVFELCIQPMDVEAKKKNFWAVLVAVSEYSGKLDTSIDDQTSPTGKSPFSVEYALPEMKEALTHFALNIGFERDEICLFELTDSSEEALRSFDETLEDACKNKKTNLGIPNRDNIVTFVDEVYKRIRRESDFFTFYFTGHGLSDGQEVFLFPSGSSGIKGGAYGLHEDLIDHIISENESNRGTSERPRSLVFLDTCLTEFFKEKKVGLPKKLLGKLLKPDRTFLFFSASKGYESYLDKDNRMGYYTRALSKALMGEADKIEYGLSSDGRLTVEELSDFLKTEVATSVSEKKPLVEQIPHDVIPDEDKNFVFYSHQELPENMIAFQFFDRRYKEKDQLWNKKERSLGNTLKKVKFDSVLRTEHIYNIQHKFLSNNEHLFSKNDLSVINDCIKEQKEGNVLSKSKPVHAFMHQNGLKYLVLGQLRLLADHEKGEVTAKSVRFGWCYVKRDGNEIYDGAIEVENLSQLYNMYERFSKSVLSVLSHDLPNLRRKAIVPAIFSLSVTKPSKDSDPKDFIEYGQSEQILKKKREDWCLSFAEWLGGRLKRSPLAQNTFFVSNIDKEFSSALGCTSRWYPQLPTGLHDENFFIKGTIELGLKKFSAHATIYPYDRQKRKPISETTIVEIELGNFPMSISQNRDRTFRKELELISRELASQIEKERKKLSFGIPNKNSF